MAALTGGIRRAVKVSLLVGAVAVAVLLLAQDGRPVTATSHTRIVVTTSNTLPLVELTRLTLYPNDPPVTLYVWAVDVAHNPGVGAFQLQFEYDASVISVGALLVAPDPNWLESTGRQIFQCAPSIPDRVVVNPLTGIGQGKVGCTTLPPPPPVGPQGTGLLASFTLTPLPVLPPVTTRLNFAIPCGPNDLCTNRTYLVSTQLLPDGNLQLLPVAVPNFPVSYLSCADVGPDHGDGTYGDGMIDVPNDILQFILRYLMTSNDPGWQPRYDLDGNGSIDVPNDILSAILQYLNECWQTV